ncbi:hypothetical protein ABVK50_29350 (plasmid) [Mesorhizobium sp. WSM2240]|uniref:Uncharacterized protein n=1 Tax=Mesorhizobium sp. WSM2240 TaxID=3228851 RepID=A0AAU8CYM6_9HYPH
MPLTPVELRRAIAGANKAFDRIGSSLANDADKEDLAGAREEINNLLNERLEEVRITQSQQQAARPAEEHRPPESAREAQTPRPTHEPERSRGTDKSTGRDAGRGIRDDYER